MRDFYPHLFDHRQRRLVNFLQLIFAQTTAYIIVDFLRYPLLQFKVISSFRLPFQRLVQKLGFKPYRFPTVRDYGSEVRLSQKIGVVLLDQICIPDRVKITANDPGTNLVHRLFRLYLSNLPGRLADKIGSV